MFHWSNRRIFAKAFGEYSSECFCCNWTKTDSSVFLTAIHREATENNGNVLKVTQMYVIIPIEVMCNV